MMPENLKIRPSMMRQNFWILTRILRPFGSARIEMLHIRSRDRISARMFNAMLVKFLDQFVGFFQGDRKCYFLVVVRD